MCCYTATTPVHDSKCHSSSFCWQIAASFISFILCEQMFKQLYAMVGTKRRSCRYCKCDQSRKMNHKFHQLIQFLIFFGKNRVVRVWIIFARMYLENVRKLDLTIICSVWSVRSISIDSIPCQICMCPAVYISFSLIWFGTWRLTIKIYILFVNGEISN